MASLTTAYLLFNKIAKENNWPMDDEKFFVAATIGFFAPYVFRFKAGDKDVGNNEAWGRRAAFFAGSSLKYPTIEDLKSHNYDIKSLSIQRKPVNKRFIVVDPVVNLSSFYQSNSYLLDKDSTNIAFYLGILSALFIAEQWDKSVQRDEYRKDNKGRIIFNGRIATIPPGVTSLNRMMRGANFDNTIGDYEPIRIRNPRSMLYKLYPRIDKQVIDMIGVDQSYFDSITSILTEFYTDEELSKSVIPYWRIPTPKQLEPKHGRVNPKYEISDDEYMERCLEIAFPKTARDYFIDEVVEEFPKYVYFKKWLAKYHTERDAECKAQPLITTSDIRNKLFPEQNEVHNNTATTLDEY